MSEVRAAGAEGGAGFRRVLGRPEAPAQTTGGFLVPLAAAVAVGALCGAINGTLVTLGRIPSIIVTLGMLYALRGVILLVTGGTWITGVPNASRFLGMGSV